MFDRKVPVRNGRVLGQDRNAFPLEVRVDPSPGTVTPRWPGSSRLAEHGVDQVVFAVIDVAMMVRCGCQRVAIFLVFYGRDQGGYGGRGAARIRSPPLQGTRSGPRAGSACLGASRPGCPRPTPRPAPGPARGPSPADRAFQPQRSVSRPHGLRAGRSARRRWSSMRRRMSSRRA